MKMKRVQVSVVLFILLLTGGVTAREVRANTLLIKGAGSREYRPGLVDSFQLRRDGIEVVLPRSADLESIAGILRSKLPRGTITLMARGLKISGLGATFLLKRLSEIPVEISDPIEALLELRGSPIAMGTPESGGSIRVSGSPEAIGGGGLSMEELISEPLPQWVGEVVKVNRGDFPKVDLVILVRCIFEKSDALTPGKEYGVQLRYTTVDGSVDFGVPLNQKNLGAFYLEPGDVVWGVNQSVKKALVVAQQIGRDSTENLKACQSR